MGANSFAGYFRNSFGPYCSVKLVAMTSPEWLEGVSRHLRRELSEGSASRVGHSSTVFVDATSSLETQCSPSSSGSTRSSYNPIPHTAGEKSGRKGMIQCTHGVQVRRSHILYHCL